MDTVLWIRAHVVAPLVLVFVWLLLTVYWPGQKKRVEANASIPLRDDDL